MASHWVSCSCPVHRLPVGRQSPQCQGRCQVRSVRNEGTGLRKPRPSLPALVALPSYVLQNPKPWDSSAGFVTGFSNQRVASSLQTFARGNLLCKWSPVAQSYLTTEPCGCVFLPADPVLRVGKSSSTGPCATKTAGVSCRTCFSAKHAHCFSCRLRKW